MQKTATYNLFYASISDGMNGRTGTGANHCVKLRGGNSHENVP